MRELWVKINPNLSLKGKKMVVEKTATLVSVFIVEPQDLELVKESGAKTTASSTEKGDIMIVEGPKEIAKARQTGKKTCILVTVKSKADEAKIEAAD